MLPDFLYIGTARAGSTWLFEALRHHPEIYIPPAKDLYFFDRHYDKGLNWYRSFFEKEGEVKVTGEMSHDYYFSEEATARIHADVPDAKIICCLREPIDKLLSGYHYNKTTTFDHDVTLAEYAAHPDIQRQFRYYDHLRRYIELFGREQVLVIFYEDLKSDGATFARSVYEFLGVDPDFEVPTGDDPINAARSARSEWLAHCAFQIGLLLRKLGLANLVGHVKQNALVNRILYTPMNRAQSEFQEVPENVVQELRADNDKLASLLGITLPESWRSETS